MNKILKYIKGTSLFEMGIHFTVGLFSLVFLNVFLSLSLSLGRYIETGENFTTETSPIHYIIGIPSLSIGIIVCVLIGVFITKRIYSEDKESK